MKRLNLHEIRKKYLDFYESKGHIRLKSFSLIPENDDSLLLINAGMAPLKPYFLGEKKMQKNRATSSQRCVRTQDIEQVGKTHRHATFFEMLGNFSFGDYFKKEAIHWAYEFLTEHIELEKERLWISVFHEDAEAYRIWTEEIGIPEEHMMKLGKEDNFWELEQGPCGPCSEIHYDRGPEFGEGNSTQDNSDRYMEVWNLVFTQFNKDEQGNYTPLQHPNIDTGMGLERINLVCEKAHNIFELEAFAPIRKEIEKLCGYKYGDNEKVDESIRVIMDHSKALTFLIYDGVVPSNEGRGYVLRRLLRRAARHGKLLGIEGAFLISIVDRVIETYLCEYPDLETSANRIKQIVKREEDNFQLTIEQGLNLLSELMQQHKEKNQLVLSGEEVFKLYDTYGFPLDLTREIASDQNFSIDEAGFHNHMQIQREQSRRNRQAGGGWTDQKSLNLNGIKPTEFLGYDSLTSDSTLVSIFKDSDQKAEKIEEGEEGVFIFEKTPFYAESGGQTGDTGVVRTNHGVIEINDTKKSGDGVFLHYGKVKQGVFKVNDLCQLSVCEDRRNDIRRNHSATHLLHKALRTVLGDHVKQAGSYVDDKRLRFDFSHFESLTEEQRKEVERLVNLAIYKSYPVDTEIMPYEKAVESGAIGLFEDKYQDEVRVLNMGNYSKELCGGTHVDNTSQIQMFRLISEQGVSSGVRRIEGITGRACYEQILHYDCQIRNLALKLKTAPEHLEGKVEQLKEENLTLQKELKKLQSQASNNFAVEASRNTKNIEGCNFYSKYFEDRSMDDLKELADQLKNHIENYCILLSSSQNGKLYFACAVSPFGIDKGLNAGTLVREAAKITGGNGGGRKDFATAGGKDLEKVEEALQHVEQLISKSF